MDNNGHLMTEGRRKDTSRFDQLQHHGQSHPELQPHDSHEHHDRAIIAQSICIPCFGIIPGNLSAGHHE
jgi:hypothetical protein